MQTIKQALKDATHGQRRRREKRNAIAPVGLLVMLVLIAQAFWLKDNQHLFRPFAIQRIQCDTCQRTGLVADEQSTNRLAMCPQCFGVGYHPVRRMDDLDRLCPACVGMGRVQDGRTDIWRTCERCYGRGLIRETETNPPLDTGPDS